MVVSAPAGWFFIRISWKLPCGPVMGAAGGVPERSVFVVGVVSAMPVGFHSYRPESFLWASLMLAVSRAGVLRGLFYVERLGVLSGGLWYARAGSQGLMALEPFSFSP